LHKKKIKLSEMWTAYYELLAKAERYIQERGFSNFSGGGETNGVNRIWKKYGIVPADVYTGLLENNRMHDHIPVMEEVSEYLDYIEEKDGLVISVQREVSRDKYCSGIQVINPKKILSVVESAEDFYTIWSALIEKSLLFSSRIYPNDWFSVDTLEQLLGVQPQN